MKIVNWNLEWMNRWFSGNNRPRWGSRSLTEDQARLCAERAAAVVRQMNPDLLCLQEGPSAEAEMGLFVSEYLQDGFEALMGKSGGAQKLFVLRRKDGQFSAIAEADDAPTRALSDPWPADVDGNGVLADYKFTRTPLVVDADPIGSAPMRIIVLHTKSKHVRFGESMWKNPNRRQDFIHAALLARRRISAEGFRLRQYLDTLVADDPGARIVVTGDWNDGPGRDMFERSYLTHNVADIVLGSTFTPDLIFDHPLIRHVPSPALFTARFDDFVDDVKDRPLLLDHFAVSPSIKPRVIDAGIAHDAFERQIDGDGRHRTERPSDHRPIWIELGTPLSA